MINIFVLVTILGHLPVILSTKSKGSEDMKQILIVEDDSFLNKMLDYNLTADGYGVTSALNARTAAEALSLIHISDICPGKRTSGKTDIRII